MEPMGRGLYNETQNGSAQPRNSVDFAEDSAAKLTRPALGIQDFGFRGTGGASWVWVW